MSGFNYDEEYPIKGEKCWLRPCNNYLTTTQDGDTEDLLLVANNPNIANRLRDQFPSPYTKDDALFWLKLNSDMGTTSPRPFLAIAEPGTNKAIGGIGIEIHSNEERLNADFGYWLGEPYWGRGIVSEAVEVFIPYTKQHWPHLLRLQAPVYEGNTGSCRVLEKNGFEFEGRLRKLYVKNDQPLDGLMYALILGD